MGQLTKRRTSGRNTFEAVTMIECDLQNYSHYLTFIYKVFKICGIQTLF